MPPLCLDCTDHEGKRVIFRESNRQKHLPKHSELKDVLNFIEVDVQQALADPDCIYESLSEPGDAVVCYKIVASNDPYAPAHLYRFVKVIVFTASNPHEVKTAYYKTDPRPREHGQTPCLYLKPGVSF